HKCTATAPTVVSALSQDPSQPIDVLFRSSNTSRMNFSSARAYPAALGGFFAAAAAGGFPPTGMAAANQHLQLSQAVAAAAAASALFPTGAVPNAEHHHRQKLGFPPMEPTKPALSPQQVCCQCSRKFANTKELKHHYDTYC